MEPIKVSPVKVLRAWGPSILICGTLLLLLMRPVIELWVVGEPDRSLISGTVVIVLSGAMLGLNAYWIAQIAAHKGYGIRDEGENLVFFGGGLGRFEKVPWASITDVEIIRAGLGERIALKTRRGQRHTILSNVLTGQTYDIAQKIKSAQPIEG